VHLTKPVDVRRLTSAIGEVTQAASPVEALD
jgi:hypothetical protein